MKAAHRRSSLKHREKGFTEMIHKNQSDNQVYDTERIVLGKTPENILRMHLARYAFAEEYVVDSLVLDVASGIGYGSKLLSNCAKEAIGGDISRSAVGYGQKEWGRRENLSFLLLDAHMLPFRKGTFDAVVSFETIEHLPEQDLFLSECARVLKKNGLLICSTCNKNILTASYKRSLNPFHVAELTEGEFFSMLRSKFSHVEAYGQLFLSIPKRIVFMLYYTVGFTLVRLRLFFILQPMLRTMGKRNVLESLSTDLKPRTMSYSRKQVPGYVVAVCKDVR